MSSMPLQCSICKNKPKFSDISHLLTHVASKGHLSAYYKLKVRANSDAASRELMQEFDTWYSQFNVEAMMHDRLNLKEKKRVRSRASASSRANSRANSAAPRPNSRASNASAASQLDPRFPTHRVKNEARPTPPLDSIASPHMYNLYPTAPLYGWHPAYPNPPTILASQHRQVQQWAARDDRSDDSSVLTSVPPTETAASQVGTEDTNVEPADDTAVADCAKLKGVLWPGMDIFDSATPEQKRKRNQKKDVSVLEALEHCSTEVEATEFIWSPTGSFKRILPITGNPEEEDEFSSPIKPTPRKSTRRRLSRAALAEVEEEEKSKTSRPPYGQLSTACDDRVENELTYGLVGQKRKRGAFQIFEDDDDQDYQQASASFGRPAPFSYLTAPYAASQPFSHGQLSMAPDMAHQVSFVSPGKENVVFHRPNPYQQGYSAAAYSLAQYHHSQPAPLGYQHHSTTWVGHEAVGFFSQPSQHMDMTSPIKFPSPMKMERLPVDDDERTITAPASEAG